MAPGAKDVHIEKCILLRYDPRLIPSAHMESDGDSLRCILQQPLWRLQMVRGKTYLDANNYGQRSISSVAVQVDIVAICEVLRRCMWILLRVEYEHLSNSQHYRRVDFIPLHFETPLSDHHNRAKDRSMISVVIELIVFVSLVLGFLLWAAM